MGTAELYLEYQRDVRRLALRLTHSPTEAEELVSATFEALPSALENVRGTSGHRTFVLGVCLNLSRHFARSAARRKRLVEAYGAQPGETADENDPESLLLRRELVAAMKLALAELSEEQREVIQLSELEEIPHAEVARRQRVPVNTVRTRLFHARRKLREALTKNIALFAVLAAGCLLGGAAYAFPAARHRVLGWIQTAVQRVRSERRPAATRTRGAPSVASASSIKASPPSRMASSPASVALSPARKASSTAGAASPSPGAASPSPSAASSLTGAVSSPAVPPPPLVGLDQLTDGDLELYQRAHALHFAEHRFEEAERAWSAYLHSAPRGPLALEAHYNRGVALHRLGRTAEARQELNPFALGEHGGYRQREAAALLSPESQ